MVMNEFIKMISCFYSFVSLGICSLSSCIVMNSGKRKSKNCYRLVICIIRLNFIMKLNKDSSIKVCINKESDLNGVVMMEQRM